LGCNEIWTRKEEEKLYKENPALKDTEAPK